MDVPRMVVATERAISKLLKEFYRMHPHARMDTTTVLPHKVMRGELNAWISVDCFKDEKGYTPVPVWALEMQIADLLEELWYITGEFPSAMILFNSGQVRIRTEQPSKMEAKDCDGHQ